jgi:EmrB/QacA subfamily drug resistance transporter
MARSTAVRIWAIGLGTAVAPLDTAVNIAFPAIGRGLDLTIGDIQWLVIAYVLTYAALMLALGRAGDLIGHRSVFRAGLVWSIVALTLCAAARSFAMLLFFRFLQGVGAALVLSCGPALITGLHAEERRGRMLGLYVMMMAIGAALGPLLGGVLVERWDWPAVFWFRVPIAAFALVLSGCLPVPERQPPSEPFDLLGAALLVLALLGTLLSLNRIGDAGALPLALMAVAASAAFVLHEADHKAPILDPRLFRLPGFARINVANVLINLAAFAVWLLVPFYLARATHLTLLAGGGVLAAASAGAIVASPVAGRLVSRTPARHLALAGAAMVAIGLLLIGAWDFGTPAVWMIGALALQGFGLGVFQLAYTDIVTATIPRHHRGVAGSLVMVTRTVGTVAAAALVMLLFHSIETSAGFLAAFRHIFLLAATLAAAVVALLARRSRAPPQR